MKIRERKIYEIFIKLLPNLYIFQRILILLTICRRSICEKMHGGTNFWGAANFAEDFFTSSPTANLVGNRRRTQDFTLV